MHGQIVPFVMPSGAASAPQMWFPIFVQSQQG
jgi:hypothetical protein